MSDSWGDLAADMAANARMDSTIDNWADVLASWKNKAQQLDVQLKAEQAKNAHLRGQIDIANNEIAKGNALIEKQANRINECINEINGYVERLDRLIPAKSRADLDLLLARNDLKVMTETNAMNYAEKKAYAAYARDVRNASQLSPVFEPLLYSGDKGSWIRERIRETAKRVFNAGGDIGACANAAIQEMYRHIQFQPPSPERAQEIAVQRWEEVSKSLAGKDVDEDICSDTLAKHCKEIRPA
jgi:hypothetical protein